MLFNSFRRFHSWQLFGLIYYLDPLADANKSAIVPEEEVDQNDSSSKWNFYFFPPFFIVFLFAIHTTVFLPYTVGVPLTWASLSTSAALLLRQIFPPIMWPQTDFAVIIAVFGSMATFASFWRHPWTLPRYVIDWATEKRLCPLLRIGNSILSPETSVKILEVHRRIRKASFGAFIVASVFASFFIYGNTYINGYYSLTNGHFLLSLVFLFPFMNAILYALYGIPTFLILASVCIQIRQKDVISQMSALNDKVKSLKKGKPKRFQLVMATFRHQNRHLNRTVLSICSQLEAYATYWTPALSLIFLIYTTLQTFMAYPVFFIDGIIFFQKICFLNLTIEIDVALFLLINVCARVVQINRRIEVANRDFYLLMAKKGAFKGKNICQQLKCEALATSNRLRSYAFHLFDNYRITSRTFYMVFSNIALFFLLVFKHSG